MSGVLHSSQPQSRANRGSDTDQNNSGRQDSDFLARLVSCGYWPARAAKLLDEGSFAEVIALCQEQLKIEPLVISGRVIYAQALFRAAQIESAEQQFVQVLSLDPNNLVALRHMGDIRFAESDEFSAFSYYRRVWEIDPYGTILASVRRVKEEAVIQTITIHRLSEKQQPVEKQSVKNDALKAVAFYTETMGDLYLAQGHSRLAAHVFEKLIERDNNPRLCEKLKQSLSKKRNI